MSAGSGVDADNEMDLPDDATPVDARGVTQIPSFPMTMDSKAGAPGAEAVAPMVLDEKAAAAAAILDDLQRALHDDIGRVRPLWTSKKPSDGASIAGRGLLALLAMAFVMQVGVRVLGLPDEYTPSSMLANTGKTLAPWVQGCFAYISEYVNLVKFARWIWARLYPMFEDAGTLFMSILGFCWTMGHAMVDGFMTSAQNVGQATAMTILGILLGLLTVIFVEAFGLTWANVLRPSFWFVALSNMVYEVVSICTRIYCFGIQLVARFHATLLSLLRRFPVLLRIFNTCTTAARYVVWGVRDLLCAAPKGAMRAIRAMAKFLKWETDVALISVGLALFVTILAVGYLIVGQLPK